MLPGCAFLLPLLGGRLDVDFEDVCLIDSSVYFEDELDPLAILLICASPLITNPLLDISGSFAPPLLRVLREGGWAVVVRGGEGSVNFCLFPPRRPDAGPDSSD